MRLRFSFEIRLDRDQPPPTYERETQLDAYVEHAAERVPFGFVPNPATIEEFDDDTR